MRALLALLLLPACSKTDPVNAAVPSEWRDKVEFAQIVLEQTAHHPDDPPIRFQLWAPKGWPRGEPPHHHLSVKSPRDSAFHLTTFISVHANCELDGKTGDEWNAVIDERESVWRSGRRIVDERGPDRRVRVTHSDEFDSTDIRVIWWRRDMSRCYYLCSAGTGREDDALAKALEQACRRVAILD